MLDKLDCRIPPATPLTGEFRTVLAEDRKRLSPIFHPTRYYRCSGDLRGLGFDAFVHLDYKYGGGNKIEFIDTAEQSYDHWLAQLSRIWQCGPRDAEIMRADVAVDIPGMPVSWFREHARFKHKRVSSRIDKAEASDNEPFVGFSSADSQTIYAGRRPNLVRIYDKVSELRKQWRDDCRDAERFNAGLRTFQLTEDDLDRFMRKAPSFEEFCERKRVQVTPGTAVTRVERQFGGRGIPKQIATLTDLPGIVDLDAFDNLRIFATPRDAVYTRPAPPGEPGNAGVSLRDHLAGIGFQTLCKESGSIQSAIAYVSRHGRGNGRRILDAIRAYMPSSELHLTTDDIKAAFRQSVRRHFVQKAEIDKCTGAKHNGNPYEIAGTHSGVLSETRQDRRGETTAGAVA